MKPSFALASVLAFAPLALAQGALEQPAAQRLADPYAYAEAFFPGASYDPDVPHPDTILGHPHASKLSHHEEILRCFERWVGSSARVRLQPYGLTHEGRELVYAVITSPANHDRLDAIRADLAALHDPRELASSEAERIVSETPPVAWMGYSIHGDETSGADASVALGYHLIASTDPEITELLSEIVVVIDPVMNPDGRERILGMVEQQIGKTTSLDWASMHRGRWPWGRGNHYLFDMNRDWMAGTQPETRGRWRAVLSFHPQLFVDAHEMGSLDTFLFYPQEKPINPFVPLRLSAWQKAFGDGIATAFDRRGWGYYTREWADGWAPFYSDAWGSLIGGTGILYEQARTLGTPLRRASGAILTYREAVHHQAVASMANLVTLAENREAVLRDYLANKQRSVAEDTPGNERTFVMVPNGRPSRTSELLRILLEQDIEVFRATGSFTGPNAVDRFGARVDEKELPAGTLIVPARQPMHALVRSFLEFDPRMDDEALLAERRDLERKGETRIYDSTSWSLPHALDLDSWWIDATDVQREQISSAAELNLPLRELEAGAAPFGWIVDGRDDTSVTFALQAMELGLQVHLSDKPFRAEGRELARGSLVVRRHENEGSPLEIHARVRIAAERSGAEVIVTSSGRSPDDGPDLGGGHFQLLARPRIAVLSNAPVAPDTFGHLWYHLDVILGAPIAMLDAQFLGEYDLRRYNVILLPQSWGGLEEVLEPLAEDLEAWIIGGGTLIACGDAAAALTAGRLALSDVTLRSDALEELEGFGLQAERERASRAIEIDPDLVWGTGAAEEDATEEREEEDHATEYDEQGEEEEPDEIASDVEAWMQRFSPYGVTLRGIVDELSWITVGMDDELPVYFSGSNVLLSKEPVQTPVRLAEEERLRLGGLVWPEARERIAESAWLTVEGYGSGQVVLFASMPAYRGYHRATARLLSNALVYGPGIGADQPVGW